jgi:outer membrane protein assembly factor BamB
MWSAGSRRGPAAVAMAIVAAVGATDCRADWPQFLGPHRNGTALETNVPVWGKEGPRTAWQAKVGAGFAGPVVAGGKALMFHRVGDEEVLTCFDAVTGTEVWQGKYPSKYRDEFGFDDGPRGTPAVSEGSVYTFGAEGVLQAWDLKDGRKRWSVNTKAEFRAPKGHFGPACSPLVERDLVVVNVGGRPGAGLVAFDAGTGRVRWKVTEDEASYASPIAATVGGQRRVYAITREALVGVNALDGALLFRLPWRPPMDASVSAATPLVIDDLIFISASYGTGAMLLRLGSGEGTPEKIWDKDGVLSNHYATSVYHDGHLYGFDGRQEQGCELRCVELKTGQVRWSQGGLRAGTVTLAGGQLLVMTEQGELVQAVASPKGYQETGRAQIAPLGVRAHPAMAAGRFYVRSKDRLLCVNLGAKERQP